MIRLIPLLLILLLVSCAPKVCPKPEEILKGVFKKPPEEVKLYGYVKTPLLRIPVVFEKRGYKERIKTPGNLLILDTSLLCYRDLCFDLPVPPSHILYGYFPGDYEVKKCNGTLLLVSEDGKELILEGGKLKGVSYKGLKVFYGERSKEGYYKEISVKLGDQEIKIFIEGKL